MKNLKKLLAVVCALALMLTFVGCGSNGMTVEDGKLIMATNAAFPPYEFVENGEYAGIDVEIAGLIAEELGLELEIADIDFGAIVDGVQSGKYDMGVAGMTVTEDRLKSVNFTTSYAKGIQSVIVKADSGYTSYEDFYTGFNADGNPAGVKEGIKIGVQQDTTGDIYASSTAAEWGFEDANVTRYKTGNEAVMALSEGKVTAVIIDNEPAKAFVAANEGLKILEGSYTDEDYAIAIAKDNEELLEKVNAALEKLIKDGKVKEIVDKYIK